MLLPSFASLLPKGVDTTAWLSPAKSKRERIVFEHDRAPLTLFWPKSSGEKYLRALLIPLRNRRTLSESVSPSVNCINQSTHVFRQLKSFDHHVEKRVADRMQRSPCARFFLGVICSLTPLMTQKMKSEMCKSSVLNGQTPLGAWITMRICEIFKLTMLWVYYLCQKSVIKCVVLGSLNGDKHLTES